MDDHSRENLERVALRDKRQICYVLQQWMDKLDKGNTEVPLCEMATQTLRNVLSRMLSEVSSNYKAPATLRALDATYALDIFEDQVQLGLVEYADDCVFDEDGYWHGESKYMLLFKESIPYISAEEWANANNVKVGTVRQWVARGRIPARRSGRTLQISAIVYPPDNLYAANRVIRYKTPGVLPETVTARYPMLKGDLLDILMMPVTDGAARVLVISLEDGKGKVREVDVRADERTTMAKALSAAGVVNVYEQHYFSPLPEPKDMLLPRFNSFLQDDDEMEEWRKLSITGKCEGSHGPGWNEDDPTFVLSEGNGCQVSGSFYRFVTSKERKLLTAIFGRKPEDVAYELLEKEGVSFGQHYSWDKSVLLVKDVKPTGNDMLFLRYLWAATGTCFHFFPGLVLFILKKSSGEDVFHAIQTAEYKELVPDKEDEECEYRFFYAYAPF